MDKTDVRKRVAGYNQFLKLVRRGKAVKVYLASDADTFFKIGVKSELSGKQNLKLDEHYTAKQLAEMAGVEVPTAVITEING
ncbi:MAG: 50S ribosomal protein L7ae-like protein [Ruminococcaceae bacterium]|nr:50S ribosomal protein L7ae-like protein [Oscillospiraceae bacterium]